MSKKNIVVTLAVVAIIFVAMPLPFKPSIWSYLHTRSLNNTLNTFTDPVYIPAQTDKSSFRFETYDGWKNAYAVKGFADDSARSGGYNYYQAKTADAIPESAEGPSAFDLEPYTAALKSQCEPQDSGVEMCVVLNPKRYVVKYKVGETYLLSDVTRQVLNKNKLDASEYPLPYDYYPPSEKEVTAIATLLIHTQAKPISEVRDHFKPDF